MEVMASRTQNIMNAISDYGRQLFGFIRSRVDSREEAEDILQDVWYQFSNQPAVEDIESVSGWLYRVARNKITDRYRKQQPELIEDLTAGDEEGDHAFRDILMADQQNPEMAQLKELFWEALLQALQELPENQRRVFEDNELGDKTLQEIADDEGVPLKTVISRKRYAVQHLRKRLDFLYQEYINY